MQHTPIPAHALQPCEHSGTLTTFDYTTRLDGGAPFRKSATVYLPCGYDPSRRYPVFYLMHGGGGDEKRLFCAFSGIEGLKNLLDQAIDTGHIQPLIVVTPTYLIPADPAVHTSPMAAADLTQRFPRELMEDLIPAFDAAYPTIPDRDHRAFGGFSMGAGTTWHVLAEAGRSVATVMPLSGDYWRVCMKGGQECPVETVDALLARMQLTGVSPAECRVLAATGDVDIAYGPLTSMIREMSSRPEFTLGDTPDQGNLCFLCKPGGDHCYEHSWEYLWQLLPWVFG